MSFYTTKQLIEYYSYMTVTTCKCGAEHVNFSNAVNVQWQDAEHNTRGSLSVEELANLYANIYAITPKQAMEKLPRLPYRWRTIPDTITRCPVCAPQEIGNAKTTFAAFVPGMFSPKELDAMRTRTTEPAAKRPRLEEEAAIKAIKYGKIGNLL